MRDHIAVEILKDMESYKWFCVDEELKYFVSRQDEPLGCMFRQNPPAPPHISVLQSIRL